MKKAIMILSIISLAASMAFPMEFTQYNGEPFSYSSDLIVNYYYAPENFYKFKFSDMNVSKDSDFTDLFDSPSLDWITMSTLENGRLKNDKNTFIYWVSDRYAPINKLMVEMPSAMYNSSGSTLDWYAVMDGGVVVGGAMGYGPENAKTIYKRDTSLPFEEIRDSVRVQFWTEDITGKPAGEYKGALVLRVIGEN